MLKAFKSYLRWSAGKFHKGRWLSWIASVTLQGFGFNDFEPFGGYGDYGKAAGITKTLRLLAGLELGQRQR